MFLLIYLYHEVKGKSTNIISIGLNLLHKLVRVRLPDLLLYFITGCPLGSLLLWKGVSINVAKGKYEEWLTAEGLILLEGWARDGLTDKQIAKNMRITEQTLNVWKKKYPSLSESLKKGKAVIDYEVENALLKNALEGDTTAQIFWLKNRRADMWRNKVETNQKQQNRLLEAQADAAVAKAKILADSANKLSGNIKNNELLKALVEVPIVEKEEGDSL